jgi:ribosomal-protein-alanine acetyltransferase
MPRAVDNRSSITLRTAEAADLAAIDGIERQSFDQDRFSRRNLRRALARPTARLVLAETSGEAAGYAMILFRKGSTAARLYSIAVDPAYRGQGVADRLLEAAVRLCVAHGADRLRLEVRPSNRTAARLYERAGFALLDRKPHYYDDGEDAIRMELDLTSRTAGGRSAHT